MKFHLLIFATLVTLSIARGQNLVPNYSFEIYTNCPTAQDQLFLATPWTMPSNTSFASSDLFNACNFGTFDVPSNVSGYQNANTGVGYAGVYTYGANNLREYLQVQLTSALIAGNVYRVEMYVSPSENAGIAVDAIGIYISTNAISGTGTVNPLPYIPQISNPSNNIISDTAGWTLVSGFYTASGGENYITIGNFLDDANTNSLIFNPSGWLRGFYWVDDVTISLTTGIESLQNSDNISIYPNPFSSQVTLRSNIPLQNATLTVDNCFGQTVLEMNNLSGKTINFHRGNLPNGHYFVKLTEQNGSFSVGKITIID